MYALWKIPISTRRAQRVKTIYSCFLGRYCRVPGTMWEEVGPIAMWYTTMEYFRWQIEDTHTSLMPVCRTLWQTNIQALMVKLLLWGIDPSQLQSWSVDHEQGCPLMNWNFEPSPRPDPHSDPIINKCTEQAKKLWIALSRHALSPGYRSELTAALKSENLATHGFQEILQAHQSY